MSRTYLKVPGDDDDDDMTPSLKNEQNNLAL